MNQCGGEKQPQMNDTLQSYYEQYFEDMRDIDGIDHVPDEIIEMMSPGSLILVEEKQMGLSFTAISILFEECNRLLKDIASDDIKDDQIIVSKMVSKILLCINGEHPKCCHIRQFLLNHHQLNLDEERHFNQIVCKKFKKSSIIWYNRCKIIQMMLDQSRIDVNTLLSQENAFLKIFFNKFPRNYHGWTYKIRLMQSLIEQGKEINMDQELEWVQEYIENNIHEYSAFNYLYFLLKQTSFSTLDDIILWAKHLKVRYEDFYIESDTASEINYRQLLSLNKFIKSLCDYQQQQQSIQQ